MNAAASLVAQTVKNLRAMPETRVQSLGWEDPLGKGMATHFSILAWRIYLLKNTSLANLNQITNRKHYY